MWFAVYVDRQKFAVAQGGHFLVRHLNDLAPPAFAEDGVAFVRVDGFIDDGFDRLGIHDAHSAYPNRSSRSHITASLLHPLGNSPTYALRVVG
jgi:hypothetical protein